MPAKSIGVNACALQLDVTNQTSIAAAAEPIGNEFGRLDVLVNNAAISHAGKPGRPLEFTLNPFPDLFGSPADGVSVKVKDAMLKKRFTERQAGVAYDHLTSSAHDVMGGMLGLASYGGCVNTLALNATASPQRGSIFDTACTTGWLDPRDEAKNLAWVRAFYRDLFSETGGVPVPGGAYDGALINHPDTDLADAAWNTSGVPWSTMYYQDNYARLQQTKAQWDPRNVSGMRCPFV